MKKAQKAKGKVMKESISLFFELRREIGKDKRYKENK